MKEGLLWFDNDPNHKLADKVKQAAVRYKVRMQCKPTICYVNVDDYSDKTPKVNGIVLRPSITVRPNYLWIGVENEAKLTKAA